MSDNQVIAAFAAARKSQSPLSHLPEPAAPDFARAFRLTPDDLRAPQA